MEVTIPSMIFNQSHPLILISIFLCCFHSLFAQEEAGAFIIVSLEGDVQVTDAAGEALPAADVAVGKSLFEGQTVITGDNGKALLLLSNGSMVTLNAKGELLLDEFKQAPFEADADTVVNDLETEPSTSKTKLKLGYGDMIFNVKKLNAGSAFDIESPVGNAGIRGTDGQLSVTVDPQTGNFSGGLNMLSGVVAFTSPGGNLVMVPAGQSVQAQATPTGQQVGQMMEMPVPPGITQEMMLSTQMAKVTTANVRVAEVTEAVEDVGERIQQAPNRKREEPSPDEPPPEEPPPDEPPPEEPPSEPSAEAPKRESTEELLEVDDQASLAQQGIVEEDAKAAKTLKSLGLNKNELRQLRKVDAEERKQLVASGDLSTVKKKVEERVEKENFIDELKAKDPDGVEKINFKKLSRDEVEYIANISKRNRKQLLKGDADSVLENIQQKVRKEKEAALDLDSETLAVLSGYSAQLQKRIREDIDPELARPLLQLHMKEAEMAESVEDLYASSVQSVLPVSVEPDLALEETVDDTLQELMELAQTGGNPQIVEILLELGDGKIDQTLLQFGREANEMLAHVEVSGRLDDKRILVLDYLRENPFFQDPVALADVFFLSDEDDGGQAHGVDPAKKLFAHASKSASLSGHLDLYDFYMTEQYLSIATTENLSLSGEIELDPISSVHETYLSLLSSGTIGFEEKTSVIFFGDNLHVGSWESMEVVNVSMEAGKALSVQTMEDLFMAQTDLRVRNGDEIFLSAQRDLRLNTVNFPDNIRNIYLEATTIDLHNINFPGGSQVDMATLYGGIDGKYPTFPGDTRQVGRVNFIENVRYDQNLMDTPKQFDQFGQNIHIRTLQP